MYSLAVVITLIPYICLAILGLRYYTHMLQLSSYQFQGYFRFLKSNIARDIFHVLFLILLLPVFFADFEDPLVPALMMLGAVGIFTGLVISYIPRQAKKKFVVTDRVKRLFVTYIVLFLVAVIIIPLLIPVSGQGDDHVIAKTVVIITAGTLYVGLLPLVTALANLINKPVEQRINRYYIDDAKRMLSENKNLRIIGITGSYGKTSVKYYLTTLLSEKYSVLMTPESYNTPMGVVRTIREHLKPTHEIFVCEMGARHLHDIKEITDIVNPDDGILTSIGPQHLETFHSIDNIISTKYELLDAVDEKEKSQGKEEGKHLKFVNGDNEIIRNNMKYSDAITYGVSEGCDFRATDIKVDSSGTTFRVTTPSGESDEFSTRLVGEHNVQNIVGAIAASYSLGVPLNKLRMGVRRLQSVPHRLELNKHGNVAILDDAYNSNPTGAKVALDTLALFDGSVKILVTPGMVELGEKEEEYNKEFGKQAAAVCDYIILVGEKNSPAIKAGALEAGFDAEKIFVKDNLNQATALMYEIDAGREKVILLENDLPDNYK